MNRVILSILPMQILLAGPTLTGQIFPAPLHPDFVEELKAAGELEKAVAEWKEFNNRYAVTVMNAQAHPYKWTSGAGIAILVDFEDNPADSLNHSPAAYDTLLFSEGVLKTGSMKDYYIENSYGQFSFSGKTAPPSEKGRSWYRLEGSYDDYWSRNRGFRHSEEMAQAAVAAADPDIDFGLYDNDGPDGIPNSGDDDGAIDAVYVIHAGPGYEEGCGKIWSHMSVTGFETNDNSANGGKIRLERYSMQPEEKCDGSLIHMGVFAHEYGHILGLPDLYDYDYDSWGVGDWSVMARGSWSGSGRSPAHFDAWCKYKLGWVEPVVITGYKMDAELPAVELHPIVYQLWTDGDISDGEYFLCENRQKIGLFDSKLPGDGLLIYHVDDWAENNDNEYIPEINTPDHHFQVAVEQADGKFQLERYESPGDQGDPYPGLVNRREFAGFLPYPTSRNYFEEDTKVGVLSISDSDGIMYANLDVGRHLPYFKLISTDQFGPSGRIKPGEEGSLVVTLENIWGTALNIEAELRIEDQAITLLTCKASFGFVDENDTVSNTSDPFEIRVAEDAPAYLNLTAELTLHETTTGLTQRFDFPILFGWPGILVVNDAKDESLTEIYSTVLDNLGVDHETASSDNLSILNSVLLSAESRDSVLIWYTGQETSTLNTEEIQLMQDFVASGGKVIISSQNLGEDIGTSGFYQNTLQAEFITASEPDVIFSGAADNPVTDPEEKIAVSGGYGTSKDGIAPRSNGSSIFLYANGNSAGIITEHDSAKVIYLAFPFEGVGGNPDLLLTQNELMRRFLNWFGYELNVSEKTPVNTCDEMEMPTTLITSRQTAELRLSINGRGSFTLDLYDSIGRRIGTKTLGILEQGSHVVEFFSGTLTRGVYFVVVRGPEFNRIARFVVLD
ncbi:M6 family metalloprotease domain-containing protein [candidate division WOR-3 bacterium]|nr:M6 family metalloprotease domain-containing protein [candidate division WOR-3 bacterium]